MHLYYATIWDVIRSLCAPICAHWSIFVENPFFIIIDSLFFWWWFGFNQFAKQPTESWAHLFPSCHNESHSTIYSRLNKAEDNQNPDPSSCNIASFGWEKYLIVILKVNWIKALASYLEFSSYHCVCWECWNTHERIFTRHWMKVAKITPFSVEIRKYFTEKVMNCSGSTFVVSYILWISHFQPFRWDESCQIMRLRWDIQCQYRLFQTLESSCSLHKQISTKLRNRLVTWRSWK